MKTISLKKVSAVAVASLGFGLLSVVPAYAAGTGTVSVGTTTPAAPVAGTAVSVPVTFTFGGTEVASETFILTASLQAYPNGATTTAPVWEAAADAGALTGSSFAAAATTTAAGAVRTSASVATVTQATTTPVNDAGGVLGNLVFTPSVPGAYMIKITGTGTGTAANAFIAVNVGGLAATQATSGVGTTTATGQVGGNASFVYALPKGAVSGSVYQITATGGTITSVNSLVTATPSFSSAAVDANLASGAVAFTGTTNVVKNNAVDFAAGATYTAGGTITSAVYDLDGASAAARAEQFTVTLTSAVAAGVTTLTIKAVTVATGATSTVASGTVTWGAAPAPSAQYSLVKLLAGAVSTNVDSSTADTTSTTVSSAAGTQRFTIQVETNDQNNVAMNGLTLAAAITGPGLIGIADSRSATTATGRSLSQALTNDYGSVSIWGDGAAGTSVVTITATTAAGVTTTLGTKTVKFAGSPSKAAVTQALYVARAGYELGRTPTTTSGAATSVATTPAFYAEVTDSNGVAVVAGSTVKMTSSDASVITVGTCAESTASSVPGTFECSVSGASGAASGKTATVTFSVLNSTTGLYDIVASPLTFTIGGAISKVVVTTDKTSYTAGEGVNLTATATDSSGNKAYDGQAWQLSAATKAASNKSMGGALPAETKEIVNGKQSTTSSTGTASLFAPSTPGSFTIAGTYAATVAAPLGTAWSVTASVADGNAAIITQIDALNAKIVALNALIAKIMKKLGVK